MKGGNKSATGRNKNKSVGTKKPVTVINGQSLDFLKTLDSYYVVSIDPAIINLGFRIEHRSIQNGIVTVNTLHMERREFKITYCGDNNKIIEDVTNFLNQFKEYYPYVALYLIESQEVIGQYWVSRIAQHISSYFYFLSMQYPRTIVAEISPKAKSKYLGGGKMKREQLVEWQDLKGLEFLHKRKDMIGLQAFHKVRSEGHKTDDMMVTLLQSEALHVYLGLPSTDDIKILF